MVLKRVPWSLLGLLLLSRYFALVEFLTKFQVFAAGVTLPKKYLWKESISLSILLLPVMFATWLISGAIIYLVFPLSYLEALLISACITPTDPVLANSIVKGRFAENNVPIHVRHIISAESGANDGLGFPYLFFAIFMLKYSTTMEALGNWVLLIWGYQILLAIIIGAIVGYLARKNLEVFSFKKNGR
ncbi:hypothetical protein DSO57_1008998 [Entomophthora muscae]|uniref:Uncharacterized protein n=1 Tax=Entomophthora muscae TaxID=34485 RepID=A0ACC2THJ3_9FUNG|nr:hypothetical protein DSO57_1008998 [Entomophthora muscae]